MRRLVAVAAVLSMLVVFAPTSSAVIDDSTIRVRAAAALDGAQEVPPVATGMNGVVKLNVTDHRFTFVLRVADNINDVFGAHLHCAPPGSNGPVGITLFSGSFTAAQGVLAAGTLTGPDPGNGCGWADLGDAAAAVAAGETYVNVHTTAASGGVPSGEIRGDVIPKHVVVRATAGLDGSQEVPPVATDMTGKIRVRVSDSHLKVVLGVADNTNDIFAAHIHCAAPGANGPVGVTVFAGSFTAAQGVVAATVLTGPDAGNGCGWADLRDVALAVAAGDAYVNVHTTAASGGVPSGEIRGNL